jgi:hypothetical protein
MAGDLPHQRQAKANTAIARLAPASKTVERGEDALPFGFGNARSAVGNAEASPSRRQGHDRRLDRRTSRIALGILQEIAHESA